MLAGEPAAIPALEAVSEHTDAMVQCWGQTEAPASTTLLSRARDAAAASCGRRSAGRSRASSSRCSSDGEVLDRPEPGVDGELVIRTPERRDHADRRRGGARRAAAARRLVAHLRPRPLRRRRAVSTSSAARARRSSPGGTNIQPVEIERAFESHAGGARGGRRRASPTRSGARRLRRTSTSPTCGDRRPRQLDDWLRDRLAGFKRPGHVFLSPDPIPRASGESKIARGDIKKLMRGVGRGPGQRRRSNVTKVVKIRG